MFTQLVVGENDYHYVLKTFLSLDILWKDLTRRT